MNQYDIESCVADYIDDEYWSDFTDAQKEQVIRDVMEQVGVWQQKEIMTHWKVQQIAEQHIQEVLRFKKKLQKEEHTADLSQARGSIQEVHSPKTESSKISAKQLSEALATQQAIFAEQRSIEEGRVAHESINQQSQSAYEAYRKTKGGHPS